MARRINSNRDPQPIFVGGRWLPTERCFTVLEPADGSVLEHVGDATPEHAILAADEAVLAQRAWGRTAPQQRAWVLEETARMMMARGHELAYLISSETGRPLRESLAETEYAAGFLRWNAQEAVRIGGEHRLAPDGATRIITNRCGVGPCLLITPWNFPAAMVTRKLGPALAAGCTAILKPAEQTPVTALWLARVFEEAGLPRGVLSVLPTTDAPRLVKTILAHDGLRKLSFTGSTGVGRRLQRACATRMLRTSMELGGNAPFLVLEDADVEAAIEGAVVAKMRNGGQACVAANRMLIHARHVERFVQGLVAGMRALRAGPLHDPSTEVGAVIDESAAAKIETLVGHAVDRGATVATGGSREQRPGTWFEPTVLVDVSRHDPLLREEIFGPVAPVVAFDSDDEAIDAIMRVPPCLAAYVYTRDVARALRLVDELPVGMVGINRGVISNPAAPFGGLRTAGHGREGGREGIHEYLDVRYAALAA